MSEESSLPVAARSGRLRSADEYRESLRDERRVFYRGVAVEDVTAHPLFAVAVDHAALDFDMAIPGRGEPKTRDDVQAFRTKMATLITRCNEAMKADLAQMKAEQAKAHADRKTKLQEKINQLDSKIQVQLQKAKDRREAAERQAQAKVQVLKAKAAAAKAKAS